jgi:hypothetical protein
VNRDPQHGPLRRRVRQGAYAVLGLSLAALVAAACAGALGSSSPETAARTPSSAGSAFEHAGPPSRTTTTIAHPGVGAGSTPAPGDARPTTVTTAPAPATSAAHPTATPVPIPLPGIAPPSQFSTTCGRDVSAPMREWLNRLPAGTTVRAPAGACYLINEGLHLVDLDDITIIGGTWYDATAPATEGDPKAMGAAFWFDGGQGVSLQNLTISGVSPGGYDPPGAFAAGIRSDGVSGLSVDDVFIDHVYGDGIELAPLRAGNDMGSQILRPSENVVLHNVWIDGAGRQGLTLADVTGAEVSGLVFRGVGIDVIDVEADQWDEGARNVDIDGCRVRGDDVGGLFFANGGAGGGPWTANVTVQHCVMDETLGGDAVLVDGDTTTGPQRGPITFSDDVLRCGSSVYVSCLQVSNGNLTVDDSFLKDAPGTIHEPIYHATHGSTVTLANDVVAGFGSPTGTTDNSSSVAVQGGSWTPYPGSSGSAPAGTSTTTTSTTAAASSGSTSTSTTAPGRGTTTSTTEPRSTGAKTTTTTTTAGRSSTTTTSRTTTTLSLLGSLTGSGSAKRH